MEVRERRADRRRPGGVKKVRPIHERGKNHRRPTVLRRWGGREGEGELLCVTGRS